MPHVLIIGASIAGCTAAALLARQGFRVTLVEKQPDPRAYKKLCTHFIQACATPVIQQLGLDTAIEAAGGLRNGLEIWARWGWIRRPKNGSPPPGPRPFFGYSLRREKLDPLLRDLAARTPQVELLMGYQVNELLWAGRRVSGARAVNARGKTLEIKADLVVGADGYASRVAELAQVPTRRALNHRFGYFAYYRHLPLSSGPDAQFWMLEPEGAYAFPNDEDLTLVTYSAPLAQLDEFRRDLESNFARAIERLPAAPRIRDAERVSEMRGLVQYHNIRRRPAQPGLALIGDAALTGDPLWGVGCGWAFQSAAWLVESLARAPDKLDEAARHYAWRHRLNLGDHFWHVVDFSTARPFNLLERLVFASAPKDPVMALRTHQYGNRLIHLYELLSPPNVLRALWVLRH